MSSIFDRSIKARLYALVGISTAGLALILGLAIYLLHRYSIKGPVYEATVLYKEFDTELSPPAMFLGPSFIALLQLQAEADRAEVRHLTDLYRQRESLNNRRHEYWMQRLPDGELKRMMENEVHAPAVEFFRVANEEY